MQIEELFLNTDRGQVAALRTGSRNGPPLLALHGWLDNAASFLPLMPHLQAFDLIAIDLPGHGHSAHRASGYDYAFADWIHDVLDVLDDLGWQQPNLLGHSMGAVISSMVAASVPQRIAGLVLIEGLGPLSSDELQAGSRLRDAVAARRQFGLRDQARSQTRLITDIDLAVQARLNVTPMREQDARLIVERNLQAVDGGFRWRSDPRLRLPAHLRINENTVHAILREITMPTLVIAADPSPPFFPAQLRQQRLDCLSQAELKVVAGGHHLHMETPQPIAQLINQFFTEKFSSLSSPLSSIPIVDLVKDLK